MTRLALLRHGETEWNAEHRLQGQRDIGLSPRGRAQVRRQRQAVRDLARPGTTSEESEELKRLRRENAELRRANDILKAASAFFAAEIDRPPRRS